MRYGSVCSGIEAATQAWHPLGWKAAFVSEIEAFPRAVLQHRWPEIPLHGDFTTIEAGEYEPIDLLVGGTPCQDFSVAGLRAGMAGDRGNLTLQFLTLARRLRPKWVVWENVPGVLSSNRGRDFGAFLGGLGELGYGWAYRTLDAQFFGVAQRRRRVFVVGYLGDWRRAAAVLFERHSLSGHPAPRRATREGTAYSPGFGPSLDGRNTGRETDRRSEAFGGGAECNPTDVATAVSSQPRYDYEVETFLVAPPITHNPYGDHESREGLLVAHSLRGEGFDASEDGTGRGTPLVPVTYSIIPQNSGKDYKARRVEVAQPVMAGGPVGGNQGGDYIVTPINADALRGEGVALTPSADAAGSFRLRDPGFGVGAPGDPAGTLAAAGPGAVAIAFALRGREGGAMPEVGDGGVSALRAASGGSSRDYVAFAHQGGGVQTRLGYDPEAKTVQTLSANQTPAIAGTVRSHTRPGSNEVGSVVATSAVRRLTPRECERLQGFPDDYTLIPWRKGMAPDGPRYYALGNSMAVPVMAWIGARIEAVEALRLNSRAAA